VVTSLFLPGSGVFSGSPDEKAKILEGTTTQVQNRLNDPNNVPGDADKPSKDSDKKLVALEMKPIEGDRYSLAQLVPVDNSGAQGRTSRTLSVMPYPKFALAVNFQTKNYDLDEIRQGSIRPIAQRLNDMSLSSVDAINRLGHWIAQVESQLRGSAETNALWWGQSLYSIRRGVSYREIPANELLVLMADELLDAAGGQVSESVIAFYVETARRLIHDLDGERSWADHGARLNLTPQGASPVSPGLRGLVSEEATGLPFTFLATGGQPARIAEATMVHERTIGGRAWARQVFRERQLNRWFSAAMDT